MRRSRGVEQLLDYHLGKAPLLVVVDSYDLLPVVGDLIEAVVPAQVDEVQDVLLEAASAKAAGGL